MRPCYNVLCPRCTRHIDVFEEGIVEDPPDHITCPKCSLIFNPFTGDIHMRPRIPPGAIWLPRIKRLLTFLLWAYTACAILSFTIILALAFHGTLKELLP